jgi:acyl carrier protein
MTVEITFVDVQSDVRRFIANNYLFSEVVGTLNNNASLLENNVLDSMGILELIDFLQEKFGISVADEELLPENLDSVNRITAYILRKLGVLDMERAVIHAR